MKTCTKGHITPSKTRSKHYMAYIIAKEPSKHNTNRMYIGNKAASSYITNRAHGLTTLTSLQHHTSTPSCRIDHGGHKHAEQLRRHRREKTYPKEEQTCAAPAARGQSTRLVWRCLHIKSALMSKTPLANSQTPTDTPPQTLSYHHPATTISGLDTTRQTMCFHQEVKSP